MKREMSSKIVSRFRGRASTPLSRPLPSFSLPLYIGTACCTQQHVSAHHTEPQRTRKLRWRDNLGTPRRGKTSIAVGDNPRKQPPTTNDPERVERDITAVNKDCLFNPSRHFVRSACPHRGWTKEATPSPWWLAQANATEAINTPRTNPTG